ncbi:uncharacterized protein LOC106177346 [Lingula anatina]|uniref:Uncharacterized protein LOC106177346 n=1 Tax=Lingula anatina TaxID=7574 RepID=A0A1S3JYS5_LINAN|nr:uncharacterized protein LOC106177346 [Lingula anatina]|eukprot:XP_013415543.1 uncharacterized protein LOC106177346 [Lingula anatina]
MDLVLFSCRQGLFFVDGAANKSLKCDETGGFGHDSLVCDVIQKREVTPEALTGQVPVAVAISGWISTAVVLIFMVVVIVVIKRRRNPTSQPFADTDHSDTSGLNQNSLNPPGSAARDHEYMSLVANNMATDNNVAEYANVNDSAYTDLGMPANESSQRQPSVADIYQN